MPHIKHSSNVRLYEFSQIIVLTNTESQHFDCQNQLIKYLG